MRCLRPTYVVLALIVAVLVVLYRYVLTATRHAPRSFRPGGLGQPMRKEWLAETAAGTNSKSSWNDGIFAPDEREATRLQRRVRVLVWVMTYPKGRDKALTVKATWGSRVDQDLLLFFSSTSDPSLPTTRLNVSEGRDHLLAKTMQSFDYVYQNYYDKADFFMKADDDTYVIMENLRYYLSHLDPDKPFFAGRNFIGHIKQGFASGGAGYVLSRGALHRLYSRGRNPPQCMEDRGAEDVELSRCLARLGVPILNSSDARGGSRFHPFSPSVHVVKGVARPHSDWFAGLVRKGFDSTNAFPITFHQIKPDTMKLLHYFVYHIRAYGVTHEFDAS